MGFQTESSQPSLPWPWPAEDLGVLVQLTRLSLFESCGTLAKETGYPRVQNSVEDGGLGFLGL